MSFILNLRKTHGYVGTYQDLDEWEPIGSYKVLAKGEVKHIDDEDPCDPTRQLIFVKVKSGADRDSIRRALEEVNSSVGCHHEWDCCGCRSYYAAADHLRGKLWMVSIGSSRNY